MKILKVLFLFIICLLAIGFAWANGPISKYSGIYRIDQAYIETLNQHYLFVGFVASLIVGMASLLLKVRLLVGGVVLLLGGITFTLVTQLQDPDALDYLFSIVLEFITPFMGVSCVVIGLLFAGKKWWGQHNAKNT